MMTSENVTTVRDAAPKLPEAWVAQHTRLEKFSPPSHLAVIYARYSTDKQSETSVERQNELCADYLAKASLTLARCYADRAMPGTSTVGRQALEELLAAAHRGEFAVLTVENVDRLARDLSILSTVFKQLKALGIEIHQPGRGKLGLPDIAFHGFMGEEGRRLFLERSQFGRLQKVRQGFIPLPPSYGYETVPGHPGERRIVTARADVVRQVFQMRLEGLTPRQIALSLNARPDRDKDWKMGGIVSLLRNPLYNGIFTYNRNFTRIDPQTRRKTVVTRPRSEWCVVSVEHLRIVDAHVWETAQGIGKLRKAGTVVERAAKRKYLLSGKVKCPECGSEMFVVGRNAQRRFACSDRIDAGTCRNSTTTKLDELEAFIVGFVADNVLDPRCTDAYVAAYNATQAKAMEDHDATREGLQRELAALTSDLDSTFDQTRMAGFPNKYLVAKRGSLGERMDQIETQLAMMPSRPMGIGLDHGRLTTLREAVDGLMARVPFRPGNEADFRLAAAFAELIDHVVVRRTAYGRFEAEVHLTVMPILERADHVVRDQFGKMHLRGSYHRKSRSHGGGIRAEAIRTRLEEGRYLLKDHEWKAIERFLPPGILLQGDQRTVWNGRTLVEAHLFVLMHGAPWSWLPERFGPKVGAYLTVSKLVSLGVWQEVATVLNGLDADRFEARFADVVWRRIKPGPRITRIVEERRAAEAAETGVPHCSGALRQGVGT